MSQSQTNPTTPTVYYDAAKMTAIKTQLITSLADSKKKLLLQIDQLFADTEKDLINVIDKEIKIPAFNYGKQPNLQSKFQQASTATLQPFTNRLQGGAGTSTGTGVYVNQQVVNLKKRYDDFDMYRQNLAAKQHDIHEIAGSLHTSTREGLQAQIDGIKKAIQDAQELQRHPDLEFAPLMKEEVKDILQKFQQIYAHLYQLSQEESYKNIGVYDNPDMSENFDDRAVERSTYSNTQFDIEQSHISGGGRDTRFLFQEFLKRRNFEDDE